MRKTAVVIHRYIGLLLAAFLFLSGITGSIIAFHHELDRWLNPGVLTVAPGRPHLLPDAWIDAVKASRPSEIVGYVEVPREADGSAIVYSYALPPDGDLAKLVTYQVFVDPATAGVLGARHRGAFVADRLHVMPFLYQFHYSLHLGQWGVWLFGGLAIIWFFDSFVGLYLAWPKRTWQAIKRALTVKWRSSATRVNYDLHRAGGIWVFAVLLVLAFTGFSMNLHEELFVPMLNAIAPESDSPSEAAPFRPDPTQPLNATVRQAVAAADDALKERNLDARLGGVFIDHLKGYYAIGYHAPDDIMAEHPGLWVSVSGTDGSVVHVRPANGFTAGDVIHDWQFPLHSGKAFGIGGRIFISVIGLVVAMLSVTGVVIWWKKRKGRVARTASVPAAGALQDTVPEVALS